MEGQTDKRIACVECIGVEKRTSPNKHFVYVLQVSWSGGMKHPIYRTYSTFFDLRSCLLDEFRGKKLAIPELPALTQFEKKGIFPFREATAEKRKKDIQDFCSRILAMSDDVICSDSVTSFFEAWYSDFAQLPPTSTMSLSRSPVFSRKSSITSNTSHFSSILDNFKNKRISQPVCLQEPTTDANPKRFSSWENAVTQVAPGPSTNQKTQSLPRGMQLQEEEGLPTQPHRCTCPYKGRKECELDLQMGDMVQVLECNQSGWWLVQIIGTGKQGWAPGAFLEPADDKAEPCRLMPVPEKEGIYFAICDYTAGNDDEISCQKGNEVQVLEKSLDGWWRVRYGSQEGLIPGMHLERKALEHNGQQTTTGSTLFHRKSIYRRGPPPRRGSESSVSSLSIEIPVYSEITFLDSNPAAASQDTAAQLSTSAPGKDMPVYAQVNKLRKTSSDEILDPPTKQSGVNEDGLRYASLKFEKCTPRVPPKQEMTEYAEIGLPLSQEATGQQASQQSNKHTYENFTAISPPPSTRQSLDPDPRYENFTPKELQEIRNASPTLTPMSSASPVGGRASDVFDFNLPHLQKGATSSLPPPRPERVASTSEEPSTPDHRENRSATLESLPPAAPNTGSRANAECFKTSDWLLGKMSRSQCETMLQQQGRPQEFLIRESTNRVGDFTLSVLYESRVRHFPIECTNNQRYYIGRHNFKDLTKVVQYYRTHPLFYDEQDQPVQLGSPVDLKRS